MFSQFLTKNSYEIEFERLGIRTAIVPLSQEELEECARMKGADGARYALYLACPALHDEGERLYQEGAIFSPLDITNAIDLRDINGAYRYIKDISGVGEAKVRLYKNEEAVEESIEDVRYQNEPFEYGLDESFDHIENGTERYESEYSEENRQRSRFTVNENKGEGADFAKVLAENLRLAARNM